MPGWEMSKRWAPGAPGAGRGPAALSGYTGVAIFLSRREAGGERPLPARAGGPGKSETDMIDTLKIYQDLAEPLGEAAARKLADALGSIYTDLQQAVTKEDFRELKATVAELAEAQGRTEVRLDTLTVRMGELAEAQGRTDKRIADLVEAQGRTEARLETLTVRMGELAEAQARTDQRMGELVEAQGRTEQALEKMAEGMDALRQEVGGLSLTMSYALENDAYRALPDYLSRNHGLRVTQRFVRTEIDEEEINFLAEADRQDGTHVLIVGESKARLDERRRSGQGIEQVLGQLRKKVAAAARAHAGVPIVPLLVTHYARPALLKAAEEEGVIVAQSFEW